MAACGYFHTAAVTEGGALFTWVRQRDNNVSLVNHHHHHSYSVPHGADGQQHCQGARGVRLMPDTREQGDQPTPRRVGGVELFGVPAVSVACAGGREGSTVVVAEDGSLWVSGDELAHHHHTYSVLHGAVVVAGTPGRDDTEGAPGAWLRLRRLGKELFGGAAVLQAACGHEHTVIVTCCGNVFTWGQGGLGQLGHGDMQSRVHPTRLHPERSPSVRAHFSL